VRRTKEFIAIVKWSAGGISIFVSIISAFMLATQYHKWLAANLLVFGWAVYVISSISIYMGIRKDLKDANERIGRLEKALDHERAIAKEELTRLYREGKKIEPNFRNDYTPSSYERARQWQEDIILKIQHYQECLGFSPADFKNFSEKIASPEAKKIIQNHENFMLHSFGGCTDSQKAHLPNWKNFYLFLDWLDQQFKRL